MARVSRKVYEWKPHKGKGKNAEEIYDAIEGNKDTLFAIAITHKSWGKSWYNYVQLGDFAKAKETLIQQMKAEGLCFLIALNCIDDLAELEK